MFAYLGFAVIVAETLNSCISVVVYAGHLHPDWPSLPTALAVGLPGAAIAIVGAYLYWRRPPVDDSGPSATESDAEKGVGGPARLTLAGAYLFRAISATVIDNRGAPSTSGIGWNIYTTLLSALFGLAMAAIINLMPPRQRAPISTDQADSVPSNQGQQTVADG